MDGKSDYESLRKQYTSSLSSVSKKIMESIFRSAKPIELSSGKPMERFREQNGENCSDRQCGIDQPRQNIDAAISITTEFFLLKMVPALILMLWKKPPGNRQNHGAKGILSHSKKWSVHF